MRSRIRAPLSPMWLVRPDQHCILQLQLHNKILRFHRTRICSIVILIENCTSDFNDMCVTFGWRNNSDAHLFIAFSQTCTLLWRHNGRDGVSNHQPHECLLYRLFGRRWKKTSKLRGTSLCAGNSPATGAKASNGEIVSFDDVIMHLMTSSWSALVFYEVL